MDWNMLYEKAFAFEKLELWEFMTDDQIFAIRVNDQFCYLSVMGNLGKLFSLGVYPGSDGLLSYYRVQLQGGNEEEYRIAGMGQNLIQCAYLYKEETTPEERKPVRAYAREHQISMKNARYPLFLRVKDYQRAHDISEDSEGEILIQALEAAAWLGSQVRSGKITIPRLCSDSKTVPLLTRSDTGFRTEFLPIPPVQVSYPVGYSDNTELKDQVRALHQRGKWACKLILVDVDSTAEGVEGLYFPWELLTVDLEANYPINVRRCRDYENRTHILLRDLMLTMLRDGRCPESILVSDPRTEAFLCGFCQEQQISLRNGEMPDMIDSLVNRNLYWRAVVESDLPEGMMQTMDFYLFAPDEKMPTDRKELDPLYFMFSSVDKSSMPDPLRKNIEKILRRIENLQNKKTPDHPSHESSQSFVISVSLGSGCYRHIQIPANALLSQLSEAILDAFEFTVPHLDAFYMSRDSSSVYYKESEWDTHKMNPYTNEITLLEAGVAPGKRFRYVYDFRTYWRFRCSVLEEVTDGTRAIKVLRSKGDAYDCYPNKEFPDE